MPSKVTNAKSQKLPAEAQRAYEVWISEIMLQQTQVKTVLSYYNKWMQKWPTVFDLAEASLSEVNEVWAGLGYYSRAKRIHEAARTVVDEYGGVLPRTAADLAAKIQGVGRYTAGAVASIAYGERAELVDGNVVRVLSRLRSIGADPKSKAAITLHWDLAKSLLDPTRPGDFNQALMEHGATVCTPQNPFCTTCPIQSSCKSFAEQTAAATLIHQQQQQKKAQKPKGKQLVIPDIEDQLAPACAICGDRPAILDDYTVTRYPRKTTKKPPRRQDTAVCILERTFLSSPSTSLPSNPPIPPPSEYLLIQRPSTGLLGGLWEFPSVILQAPVSDDEVIEDVDADTSYTARMQVSQAYIEGILGHPLDSAAGGWEVVSRRDLGSVKHLFSHIEQMYWAEHVVLSYTSDASSTSRQSTVAALNLPHPEGPTTTAKPKQKSKRNAQSSTSSTAPPPPHKWIPSPLLSIEAIPTGLKKVFALLEKQKVSAPLRGVKRKGGESGKLLGKEEERQGRERDRKVRRIGEFFGKVGG